MMRAKLNEDPRPPHEVFADIDPKVEEIILHSVDRSPRERYVSAKEMLADLEEPARVVPRDRTGRGPRPLLERIRIPRRILVPTVVVLVIGFLLVLTWVTGKPPSRGGSPQLRSAEPASSAGR
jgi:hypothetical protein